VVDVTEFKHIELTGFVSQVEYVADRRVFIVAEVAQTHDGSLGQAHAFIDAVARAGADAIKFQTHIAASESTPSEPWRVVFSKQDSTRYEYWKRMEFSEEQWCGLKTHADQQGLKFLSSPFSVEAVEMLSRVGVAAWKVASGEVGNDAMFKLMAQTGLPMFLSTGMSTDAEIDRAVDRIKEAGLDLTVLQCTSMYPTPPEKLGLNLLNAFRERYGSKVGLSDHSGTIYAGLAGATLGIDVLEIHVTMSREMFGPDVPVSLTTSELAQLVEGVRFIETALESPINKDEMARELKGVRELFTRSVVARRRLRAGSILSEDDLVLKKPGTGIPPERLKNLIGRKLLKDVEHDALLQESDLE
jgi:N,N'-diacetyllegionaminate synthase